MAWWQDGPVREWLTRYQQGTTYDIHRTGNDNFDHDVHVSGAGPLRFEFRQRSHTVRCHTRIDQVRGIDNRDEQVPNDS